MTTIAELVAEYPVLRAVMKRFHARFLPCGLAILTAPLELGGWRIHGDFVVDRAAVRRQAKSGQIKQDFLAHDPAADRVIYFSGEVSGAYPAIGRHINELAAKLRGTAHYGVDPAGRRIGNHHYSGINDPDLPVEPEARLRIRAALARVEADEGIR
ncbi:MAG TPA: hypothetical protein VG370_03180 [Chloroflexota bacterium]|jgi:hypothetical protein|nr:hypothetical protein [Chloroflexota bacterium]